MSSMSTDDESSMSSMSLDNESMPRCDLPGSSLMVTKLTTLALAIFLMTITLILIPRHRRLRKRHHIFPYNLVLSDLSGAIAFAIFEAVELPEKLDLLVDIISTATFVVSLLSIVLITGYQFITIRLDPFGALNIITTPRLIATCVLTWVISFAISSIIAVTRKDLYLFFLPISWTGTITTGLCYIFIYRSIAKVPCDGRITLERKEQNQRVLRTFGLVFGTTVLCWIFPWVIWTFQTTGFENDCLIHAADIMININWISNSIIYWWRLEEFRSMFTFCRGRQGTAVIQISLVTDL